MERERKGKQVLVPERTAETRQTHVVMGPGAFTHGSVSMSGETSLNYATTINNYGNLFAHPGKSQTEHGKSVRPAPIRLKSSVDAIHFKSREKIFNEIIDALSGNQFNVIGIWGMGGIGKTTLAIKVAEQAYKDKLFDVVVMATVSRNLNLKAIQGQIADDLGLELKNESVDGRANHLFQNLQSYKRVLIILDDIWESIEFRDIGVPYGAQHEGCKFILTSRNLEVCRGMGSQKNFQVELLLNDEAANLFSSKAGDYDDFRENVSLAKQIIEECGGLPLAVAIVAAGLRGQDMWHWKDTANRLEKSDLDIKVFVSIEFSIKILSQEAQRLLLLCSLFPEDYDIPIERLWLYGLGLNFFEKVDDAEAALTRVEKLASSLKSSCLLLEGREKNAEVKMHNVVRDAALKIASKDGHMFLTRLKGVELSKLTAISFCPSGIQEDELPHKLECPLLEILILNCPLYQTRRVHRDFFTGMKRLTFLQMSEMKFEELPQSLECLENLRVLCFSKCRLKDISRVGRLKKLIVLAIYDSKLMFLPREVGQLTNLRILMLKDTSTVVKCTLQGLFNLEALLIGDISEWKYPSLGEVMALSHLKILEIYIPYVPSYVPPILPPQLPFEKFSRFHISIGIRSGYDDYPTTLALKKCHEVVLSSIGINKLMKKVEFLSYRDMFGLSDILLSSNLHGDGVLKKLEVERCNEVEYISSTKNWDVKSSFPPLHELYLRDLISLKEIFHGNLVTLNNLTHLKVVECHQLEHIFTCTVAKSLSKLRSLRVEDCKNLEVIIFRSEEETLMEVEFTQLSELWLEKLPKLKCLDSFSIVQESLLGEQVHCPSFEMNKFKEKRQSGLFHCILVTLSNLTHLAVIGCHQLQYIFTRTVAKTLSRMETLAIDFCHNLEVIIYNSEEETLVEVNGIITFPQLTHIHLWVLPNFKCFDSYFILQGSLFGEQVQCSPSLEVTILKEKSSSEFFSGCPKLRIFEVIECGSFPSTIGPHITLPDNVEVFLLAGPECPYEDAVHLRVLATSPRLKLLILGDLSKLQRIEWNTETYHNLEVLGVFGCKSLTSLFEHHKMFQFASQSQEALKQDTIQPLFDRKVEFGALKCLTIDGLCKLEQVHSIEGPPLFLFPHLEEMTLSNLHSLKHLWWNDNVVKDGDHELFGLPKLYKLEVVNCGSLRFVFTSCAAKQFRRLIDVQISNCEMMEEIVVSNEQAGNLGDECEPHDHIVFPSLARLRLKDLGNLRGFYMGKSTLELPDLRSMSIKGCPHMKIFCLGSLSTPQLDSIELDDWLSRISNKGLNNMLLLKFRPKKGDKKVIPTRRFFGCFGCFDNLSSSDEDYLSCCDED